MDDPMDGSWANDSFEELADQIDSSEFEGGAMSAPNLFDVVDVTKLFKVDPQGTQTCKDFVKEEEHRCMMQVTEAIPIEENPKYIFFDYETYLDENNIHVLNLVVAQYADGVAFRFPPDNQPMTVKEELVNYCSNDVTVLRLCTLKFREDFLKITNIDPFREVTRASACRRFYTTYLLHPGEIGVISANGYQPNRKTSFEATEYFEYLNSQGHEIVHGRTVQCRCACSGRFHASLGFSAIHPVVYLRTLKCPVVESPVQFFWSGPSVRPPRSFDVRPPSFYGSIGAVVLGTSATILPTSRLGRSVVLSTPSANSCRRPSVGTNVRRFNFFDGSARHLSDRPVRQFFRNGRQSSAAVFFDGSCVDRPFPSPLSPSVAHLRVLRLVLNPVREHQSQRKPINQFTLGRQVRWMAIQHCDRTPQWSLAETFPQLAGGYSSSQG
ncbi:hypothetical protein BV898_19736 [Hypsibius exemplaris]|uniref:Uncharacterized protein n=1 Tax=Hypsibius exemplaris TaxID=2072580 RepID=A0A9X6NK72_HYPEX|nr:hypothetical protein BV898_19736 [Hypsibius exemplaris]